MPAVLDYDTSSCVPKIHHKQELIHRGQIPACNRDQKSARDKTTSGHIVLCFSYVFRHEDSIVKAGPNIPRDSEYVYSGKSMKLESDCCCSALYPLLAQF